MPSIKNFETPESLEYHAKLVFQPPVSSAANGKKATSCTIWRSTAKIHDEEGPKIPLLAYDSPFRVPLLGFAHLANLTFRRARCVLRSALECVQAARGNLRRPIDVSRGEAALLRGSAKPPRTLSTMSAFFGL